MAHSIVAIEDNALVVYTPSMTAAEADRLMTVLGGGFFALTSARAATFGDLARHSRSALLGFDRALGMIASGKVDLKPLISETFDFARSIEAFERAALGRPADVKLQIELASTQNW